MSLLCVVAVLFLEQLRPLLHPTIFDLSFARYADELARRFNAGQPIHGAAEANDIPTHLRRLHHKPTRFRLGENAAGLGWQRDQKLRGISQLVQDIFQIQRFSSFLFDQRL